MNRGKIIGYPEALIDNPEKDGFDAVIDFLNELGAASRGVGVQLGYLSASRRRSADHVWQRLGSSIAPILSHGSND
jgi:hypothetical protein